MKLIKGELLLCLSLTVLVFVCALAWGSPFLAGGRHSAPLPVEAAQTVEFNGAVLRNGSQYLLRDSSGHLMRLDDARSIQSFAGKSVTVTGTLDRDANTIRVARIAPAGN